MGCRSIPLRVEMLNIFHAAEELFAFEELNATDPKKRVDSEEARRAVDCYREVVELSSRLEMKTKTDELHETFDRAQFNVSHAHRALRMQDLPVDAAVVLLSIRRQSYDNVKVLGTLSRGTQTALCLPG